MNKPVKTKLCWNCEGSVSRTIENCPYCGVYLSPESASGQEDKASPTLYKPPYSPDSTQASEVPKAPYQPKEEAVVENIAKAPSIPNPLYTVFVPVLLLTSGSLALFFSVILFLFSTDGTLTLQWSGDSWYLYGLLALPLLFFGWRWLDRSTE